MIGATEPVKAAAIPDVCDDGKIIQAFYDAGRKCYWVENSRGGWIEFNEQSLKRLLRANGLRAQSAMKSVFPRWMRKSLRYN